jgi:hypothetical protein
LNSPRRADNPAQTARETGEVITPAMVLHMAVLSPGAGPRHAHHRYDPMARRVEQYKPAMGSWV